MHLEFFPLSGGFLGVDIFFVLSGFLLSRNLIREYESNVILNKSDQYFSIINFYWRRFFRIVPAAVFVASITLASVFAIASPAVTKNAIVDYLYVLFFAINFRLIQQQTDYFLSSDLVSFFQHYWSLASEEQFYIILPLILLLTLKKHDLRFNGRHVAWRTRLNIAISVLTVISFLLAVVLQEINQIMNYFLFLTRIWEFGFGILVAINQSEIKIRIKKVSKSIHYGTYLLILSAYFLLDPTSSSSMIISLIIVISVSLFLAQSDVETNATKKKRFPFVLEPLNRILIKTGDVSFSLYLWHWPVILLSRIYFSEFEDYNFMKVLQLILTYILALITYSQIEQRFRKVKLRDQARRKYKKIILNLRHDIRTSSSTRKILASLITFSVILNLGYLHKTSRDHWDSKTSILNEQLGPATPVSTEEDFPILETSSNTLYSLIRDATKLTKLSGSEIIQVESLVTERNKLWSGICDTQMKLDFLACFDGKQSAKRNMVYVGDSYVEPFYRSIPEFLGQEWSHEIMYFGQCTFSTVNPYVGGARLTKCIEHRQKVLAHLEKNPPDALFISENWSTPIDGINDVDEAQKIRALSEGLRISLQKISKSTQVFFFGSPPIYDSLASCSSRSGVLKPSCFSTPSSSAKARSQQSQVIREFGGVFIDPIPMLCADLSCPPVVDGTAVTYDGSHLNLSYLLKTEELFQPYFVALRSE
jgi:peptidoglycan/LPS O-acetylase OafA/YrhL